MPNAYVMIHLEVINREEFISGFASKIPALLAEFGGKALISGPDTEVHFFENRYLSFQIKSQHWLGATVKHTRLSCPTGRTTHLTLTLQS